MMTWPELISAKDAAWREWLESGVRSPYLPLLAKASYLNYSLWQELVDDYEGGRD